MSSFKKENTNIANRKSSGHTLMTILKVLVPVFVLVFVVLFVLNANNKPDKIAADSGTSPNADYVIKYNGESFVVPRDAQTIMIIGRDMFDAEVAEDIGDYYNYQQADFIMYAVFDNANEEVRFLQINRDTICDVQWLTVNGLVGGIVEAQICLAHTYGSGGKDSCENVATALKTLLFEAPINGYISFTMDSVGKINDLVGGVTVTVEDDLTSVDPALEKGKTVKLFGEQALKFVRARRGINDGDNRERMRRQRQYLDSFVESAREAAKQNENLSSDAFSLLKDSIVTNLSSAVVTEYADKLNEYKLGDIVTADGTATIGEETGWAEFYVDNDDLWSKLKETLSGN